MKHHFVSTRKARPSGQSDLKRFFFIVASSALATGALILLTSNANAQEPPRGDRDQDDRDWNITVGAGAIYTPDYEGSDDYQVLPFPFLSVSYKDIVYIRGPEIGVNVLRLAPTEDMRIKLGPIARYRRDRSEDRNIALKGLGNVGAAVELGGAARFELGRGWLQLSVAKDVAGAHDGVVVQGEAGVDVDLADRLSLSARGTTSWVDRHYMQTYFSVTPAQSARSGLPVFDAGKGIKDAGASLGLSYRLNDHWLLAATAGYTRLLNDAKLAPVVSRRGSPDQWLGGAFLAYRF
ncbi:MAG: MipA/OmpV family protein [Candidatus Sphingomonas phytovorans]|nr:MipA/OmpV family protein [Sphingomonas sp.]WEK02106.1 MAG: MipA/OmpV family protein [Sphingomonas sp.]